VSALVVVISLYVRMRTFLGVWLLSVRVSSLCVCVCVVVICVSARVVLSLCVCVHMVVVVGCVVVV
jgi:hypothetical protein